jgi:hypothetical protein
MVNLFWLIGYFSISTKRIGMKVYTHIKQCTGHDPYKLHNSGYHISCFISPFFTCLSTISQSCASSKYPTPHP